jgi:hypothetical protein
MLISLNSFGEWIYVTSDVDNVDYIYVDNESIIKKERYLYFWELDDYGTSLVKSEMVLSAKAYYEVNCQTKAYKILSDYYYSNQMGNGEIVHQSNVAETEWSYTEPDSMGAKLITFSCEYIK